MHSFSTLMTLTLAAFAALAAEPVVDPLAPGAKVLREAPFSAAEFQRWTVIPWKTGGEIWELVDQDPRTYLHCRTDAVVARIVTGEPDWADYRVEVRSCAARLGPGKNGDYGLIARYTDAGSYYLFLYDHNPGVRALIIQKRVAGVGKLTTLASLPFTYEIGRWYTFTGVLSGDRLEFWVDGQKRLTATDADIRQGKAGLLTWFGDVLYDGFSVQALPAVGPARAAE